ncbi:hypothetical protein BU23DRAFT_30972 [Bimuria novae-zelandiae CBS 107.79]|uniref:Uncharacterized protein n=1 Tax=Bimuria novae-zelandiae CBS 107.79 TaxID=1447943 RepID=A0A6A5VHF2_9PLEO|nr:hypothetical protein BU23DRAFT_30972 [Bimuria novae-zelandiae CBS 107.79]
MPKTKDGLRAFFLARKQAENQGPSSSFTAPATNLQPVGPFSFSSISAGLGARPLTENVRDVGRERQYSGDMEGVEMLQSSATLSAPATPVRHSVLSKGGNRLQDSASGMTPLTPRASRGMPMATFVPGDDGGWTFKREADKVAASTQQVDKARRSARRLALIKEIEVATAKLLALEMEEQAAERGDKPAEDTEHNEEDWATCSSDAAGP